MHAGVKPAIILGGIAVHSTNEWSRGGCKGICVLAVFHSLNFELPVCAGLGAGKVVSTAEEWTQAHTLLEYQDLYWAFNPGYCKKILSSFCRLNTIEKTWQEQVHSHYVFCVV